MYICSVARHLEEETWLDHNFTQFHLIRRSRRYLALPFQNETLSQSLPNPMVLRRGGRLEGQH